ncbi:unnamed protein product [Adineta ricciae]|uniref:Uncharacterized protein n=1 Tax=Adineta ricciae TaxID=249248 RepID=A0A815IXI6_ADIRI|nr:unnamed protein product [Adineta ricciae]
MSYEGVRNGTVDNTKAAQRFLNELQTRLNGVEKDLEWHRNRVENLEIATIFVAWIPIAGWIAGGGMLIAVADNNKTELLPGLLPFVPNMPVLLTDNIACELGLSNGTQGIFRELVYDDQQEPGDFKIKSDVFPSNTIYIRKPLYALVEINTSQVETNLDGLRPKLIPIPLIKKRFTVPIKQLFGHLLDRVQSGRKIPQVIQVTRTQLPIVPAFAITTYKAQGLTMNKIVVDLQVPPGTLQVASIYVPLSRVKKGDDIVILRPFDMKVLQVQPSSAQDAELKRLDELDKKTKREFPGRILRPGQIIFCGVAAAQSVWGMFVNKKELKSYSLLHIITKLLALLVFVVSYIMLKCNVDEVSHRQMSEDCERSSPTQQQHPPLIEEKTV